MKKIKHYIICIFSMVTFSVNAQGVESCGTSLTAKNLEYRANRSTSFLKSTQETIQIPISIHVVRNDSGISSLDENTLNQAILDLNTNYASANMEFIFCGAINYIDNTALYDYEQAEEDALAEPTERLQTLNLYFVNELIYEGASICGYAKFPEWGFGPDNRITNRVIIKNSCCNGHILAHEIGHFFGLLHTHETSWGFELVDGSNCDSKGDRFCDTPADPNLSGQVILPNCMYTGSATDSNGDSYYPLTNNIMSYTNWACSNSFTAEQIAYALSSINYDRSYLACDGNYSVEYACEDWNEPNNSMLEADSFEINNPEVMFERRVWCLPKDDIDWLVFIIDGESYYLKIDAVNNAFGDYSFFFTRNHSLLTFETSQRTMLDNDTRLELYAGDQTTLLASDDNGGEGKYSKIVFNLDLLSIKDKEKEKITIFPNPAENVINLNGLSEKIQYNIKIIDTKGEQQFLRQNSEVKNQIDISSLSNGVYFIKIVTETENFTYKILKK